MSRRRYVRRRSSPLAWVFGLILGFGVMAATFGILAKPESLAAKLGARYVVIDLSSGRYCVKPAVSKGPGGEDFASMMQRLRPCAAITGTFYDSDYCPQGDIVADGKIVCRGHHRQGIGFTPSGKIRFVERKINHRISWRGFQSGIASGPRLVRAGKVAVDVRRDGFSRTAATLEAGRCAVGATANGRLIMCVVTQPITLAKMAAVMVELGATDAINLDGGGSCALYEKESCVVLPQRPVSNVLAVYKRQ